MVSEVKFGKEVDANGNITAINHSVELFNTTDADIDLSLYTLELVPDTGAPTVMNLSGNIPTHGTFVLTNVNSSQGVIALADAVEMLLLFDGKVSIELKKGNSIKDKIGKENVNDLAIDIDLNALIADPVGYLQNAEIDLGSIENLTIRRKPIVQRGKSTFSTQDFIEEWNAYPESYSQGQGLGAHTNACVVPVINWRDEEMEIIEASTGVFPVVTITGEVPNTVYAVRTLDEDPTPGAVQIETTGLDQDAYYTNSGQNDIILFSSLGNTDVTLGSTGTIVNDTDPEPTESFALYLNVTSGGSSDASNPLIVKILDNDGLSVQEADIRSKIDIRPSIFSESFVIESKDPDLTVESVTLVDVMGRSVSVRNQNVQSNRMTVQSQRIADGYISVLIRTNHGLTSKKLLKIRTSR